MSVFQTYMCTVFWLAVLSHNNDVSLMTLSSGLYKVLWTAVLEETAISE